MNATARRGDAYLDVDGFANAEADGENDGHCHLAGGGAGAEKGGEMRGVGKDAYSSINPVMMCEQLGDKRCHVRVMSHTSPVPCNTREGFIGHNLLEKNGCKEALKRGRDGNAKDVP